MVTTQLPDVSDRRLSADNTLESNLPSTSSAPNPPPTARPPSDTPYSPRPRLFDNLPLPDGPQASDVLSDADYRQLRARAFSPRTIIPPLIGSAAIGYFSPRLFKTKPGNVGIVRTGMFTVSLALSLSYTTYSQLSTAISSARIKAQHAALPRTADGQVIMPDGPTLVESVNPQDNPGNQTLGERVDGRFKEVDDELANLGKKKARTRWAKGRGLSGEVEEEVEMRDTYLRPGSPRRET